MDKVEFWKTALGSGLHASPGPVTKMAHNTLQVSPFVDNDYWFLLKPIKWTADEPQDIDVSEVKVPTGFVTDFASIPQVFYAVLPPIGRYTYAAILHDYLYWFQPCERGQADDVLNRCMQEMGVAAKDRLTIYNAVKLGGGPSWKKNAAARTAGERRVLKRFPNDPMISWDIWKSDHENFE